MIRAILRNWPIKLLALLASIVLWFYFNIEDREISRTFRNVTVEIKEDNAAYQETGLEVITGKDQTVEIVLSGKKSIINSIDPSQVRAWAELTGISKPGQHNLKVMVTVTLVDGVIIDRTTPGTINVNVDKFISKRVPIEVRTLGDVSDGYLLDSVRSYPTSINVTGPSVEVDRVVEARVDLGLDGTSASLEQTLNYTLVDERGEPVVSEFIATDVPRGEVSITAAVLKKKVLPLEVILSNNTMGDLVSYDIQPKSIEVAGPEDILDDYASLVVGRMEVSLLTENEEPRTYDIILPSGVKNLSDATTATVRISMQSTVSKEVTTNNIQITGQAEGYIASLVSENITVTVRGLPADIETVTPNDILVKVDVSAVNAAPGTYPALVAIVQVTSQKNVGAEGLYYVGVIIEEQPPPDETLPTDEDEDEVDNPNP